MNIWFDILHPAQLNFYKYSIKRLSEINHHIFITLIDRGKLIKIAQKELSNNNSCRILGVGLHRNTKLSIIFEANIKRLFQLFFIIKKEKPDVELSNGFIGGIIAKLFKIPSIQFGDDVESVDFFLKRLTSSKLFYPFNFNKKIGSFNALKEWAYLSPKYFSPNEKELKKYKLEPKNYFFIREISPGSLNYRNQSSGIIASFARRLPKTYKVILSLEDKKTIKEYPSEWILLEEPVEDIHSLLYYSKLIISSGDSMAREGAMLGVPSIYCGVREMRANEVMIKKGMMFKINSNSVPDFVEKIMDRTIKFEEQITFRKKLLVEWDDVTAFIIEKILNCQNKTI